MKAELLVMVSYMFPEIFIKIGSCNPALERKMWLTYVCRPVLPEQCVLELDQEKELVTEILIFKVELQKTFCL